MQSSQTGYRILTKPVRGAIHLSRWKMTLSQQEVLALDSRKISARLDELWNMQDGWLNSDGVAPSQDGLDWLNSSFECHFPMGLPLPYIFPTPEGGIEAEWSIGRYSVMFEIDMDSKQGDWLRFDKQSDEEDARLLDMGGSGKWEWVVSEIRHLVELAE